MRFFQVTFASCFEDYVASPCFFCIVLEQQLAHQQLKASYHKTEENCKQMRAIVPVNHDLMLQSVKWSDMQKLDRGFRSANSLNNHLAVSNIKSLNVCEVKTSGEELNAIICLACTLPSMLNMAYSKG